MLDEEEVMAASGCLLSSVEIPLCFVGIDLRSLWQEILKTKMERSKME